MPLPNELSAAAEKKLGLCHTHWNSLADDARTFADFVGSLRDRALRYGTRRCLANIIKKLLGCTLDLNGSLIWNAPLPLAQPNLFNLLHQSPSKTDSTSSSCSPTTSTFIIKYNLSFLPLPTRWTITMLRVLHKRDPTSTLAYVTFAKPSYRLSHRQTNCRSIAGSRFLQSLQSLCELL